MHPVAALHAEHQSPKSALQSAQPIRPATLGLAYAYESHLEHPVLEQARHPLPNAVSHAVHVFLPEASVDAKKSMAE